MKNFIVQVIYKVPVEKIDEILAEHRAFLQEGYAKGWLLCSGPQVPRIGGLVVARAPSLEDLQNFFKNDPYNRINAADYIFTEFEPVNRQAFIEDWVTGKAIK
jgi:uncharacterized protein YciI